MVATSMLRSTAKRAAQTEGTTEVEAQSGTAKVKTSGQTSAAPEQTEASNKVRAADVAAEARTAAQTAAARAVTEATQHPDALQEVQAVDEAEVILVVWASRVAAMQRRAAVENAEAADAVAEAGPRRHHGITSIQR